MLLLSAGITCYRGAVTAHWDSKAAVQRAGDAGGVRAGRFDAAVAGATRRRGCTHEAGKVGTRINWLSAGAHAVGQALVAARVGRSGDGSGTDATPLTRRAISIARTATSKAGTQGRGEADKDTKCQEEPHLVLWEFFCGSELWLRARAVIAWLSARKSNRPPSRRALVRVASPLVGLSTSCLSLSSARVEVFRAISLNLVSLFADRPQSPLEEPLS